MRFSVIFVGFLCLFQYPELSDAFVKAAIGIRIGHSPTEKGYGQPYKPLSLHSNKPIVKAQFLTGVQEAPKGEANPAHPANHGHSLVRHMKVLGMNLYLGAPKSQKKSYPQNGPERVIGGYSQEAQSEVVPSFPVASGPENSNQNEIFESSASQYYGPPYQSNYVASSNEYQPRPIMQQHQHQQQQGPLRRPPPLPYSAQAGPGPVSQRPPRQGILSSFMRGVHWSSNPLRLMRIPMIMPFGRGRAYAPYRPHAHSHSHPHSHPPSFGSETSPTEYAPQQHQLHYSTLFQTNPSDGIQYPPMRMMPQGPMMYGESTGYPQVAVSGPQDYPLAQLTPPAETPRNMMHQTHPLYHQQQGQEPSPMHQQFAAQTLPQFDQGYQPYQQHQEHSHPQAGYNGGNNGPMEGNHNGHPPPMPDEYRPPEGFAYSHSDTSPLISMGMSSYDDPPVVMGGGGGGYPEETEQRHGHAHVNAPRTQESENPQFEGREITEEEYNKFASFPGGNNGNQIQRNDGRLQRQLNHPQASEHNEKGMAHRPHLQSSLRNWNRLLNHYSDRYGRGPAMTRRSDTKVGDLEKAASSEVKVKTLKADPSKTPSSKKNTNESNSILKRKSTTTPISITSTSTLKTKAR